MCACDWLKYIVRYLGEKSHLCLPKATPVPVQVGDEDGGARFSKPEKWGLFQPGIISKVTLHQCKKHAKAMWLESAAHLGYFQLKSALITKKGEITYQLPDFCELSRTH